MTTPPRDVTRSVPFTLERADGDGDGLTLEGYAAVFNQPTRIDSWEGLFDETIAKGAFRKTLRERTPVLQFDHGHHPLLGSIPLGRFESLKEDTHGLYVKARLSDNWLVEPVRDAIRDEAITGMSFRFQVVKDKWDNQSAKDGTVPSRTIQEVKLMELGPVVFPAYEGTSVGVRSAADLLGLVALNGLPPYGEGGSITPDALAAAVAAITGTRDAEPPEDPEPPKHSGLSRAARARALALRNI